MICKTLSRKLKIEQHEPPLKMVMDSGIPQGRAILNQPVTPVVLLLLHIWC
jgi:hypothetical protein